MLGDRLYKNPCAGLPVRNIFVTAPIMSGGTAKLTINGNSYAVPYEFSDTSLNDFLRQHVGLTGTKVLCREGGCGVCVVYVEYPDPSDDNTIIKKSINSCLCPVLSCDGWNITTVEGLGTQKNPHEIQKRLTQNYGTQCGYCTPGFVMGMYNLTKNFPGNNLTTQMVEDSFDGNICRCTGYRPILTAFKSFASYKSKHVEIEDCEKVICPRNGKRCLGHCAENQAEFVPAPRTVLEDSNWYQPTSLPDLYKLITQFKDKKVFLVNGRTSIGVYFDGPFDLYIDMKKIPEIRQNTLTSTSLTIGSGLTLTEIIGIFESAALKAGFGYLAVLAAHVRKIAGLPVRNAGTWAGNLMIKYKHREFPSDAFLCFELARAQLTIVDAVTGSQTFVKPSDFLQTDMTSKVIVNAVFPTYSPDYLFRTFKIMPRSQNAHAIVNAGFSAQVIRQANKAVLVSPTLVFGNISETFVHAIKTETYLLNRDITSPDNLASALRILRDEIQPTDLPDEPSPAYKNSLSCALFYKYALEIIGDQADPRFRSAIGSLVRPVSHGTQSFPTDPNQYPITEPVPKIESMVQCTGEAKYISDYHNSDLLYAAFAISQQGSADLVGVDGGAALRIPGVVKVLTAFDIPGENNFNLPGMVPEPILATSNVTYAGQPVAIVVATSQRAAELGARLVKVNYANIKKPLLTCRDAIAAKSFFPNPEPFSMGDAATAVKNSAVQVSGELEIGSQFHFHMETHVTVCVPTEDGMEVESSTQWVDSVQDGISQCLGVKKNGINVTVKRIGGAYGAKITRNNLIACATALAANAVNKPVKMHLSLWDNARIIGKRNPYYVKYQAGVDKNGKLQGVILDAYGDCGAAPNDSAVSGFTLWGDGGYHCANWQVTMTNCQTNLPPNTWTRAPGSTEAIYVIEYVMEHLARKLTSKFQSAIDFKTLNFYQNGDTTITGQTLNNCVIDTLTSQLLSKCNYNARFQDIKTFNQGNRWRKRGIAVTPIKYGSTWNGNQYGCLLAVFHNSGTVAVSHAGCEIGQGINTKVAQVVARELGVPLENVAVKPNHSFYQANASSTGGSMTSELVCLAALDACGQLNKRLQPVKDANPGVAWAQLIDKAFGQGIDLSVKTWCAPNTPEKPVNYNTYGAMVTEVELDVLTGERIISQVDVLYDCGESISPIVDVGQVEGAIVMGLGYYTCEELIYDPANGQNLTYSTWKYKPPTTKDIPVVFNVELLKNNPNPFGVLRSKLVAEPPLNMTASVVFALRNACEAALQEIGEGNDWFQVDAPMTVARIQQYCAPDISQFTYK